MKEKKQKNKNEKMKKRMEIRIEKEEKGKREEKGCNFQWRHKDSVKTHLKDFKNSLFHLFRN